MNDQWKQSWRALAASATLALLSSLAMANDVEGPPEPESDPQPHSQPARSDANPTAERERERSRQRGGERMRAAFEGLDDAERTLLREHLTSMDRSSRRAFLREFLRASDAARKDMIQALDEPG